MRLAFIIVAFLCNVKYKCVFFCIYNLFFPFLPIK